MKIALFGYGKMGKAIERIALKRHHDICARINVDTDTDAWQEADVIIDFSLPEVAFANIKKGLGAGIPVISGTTGWLERYEEATRLCTDQNGAFLYASNFSLGVNLFFALNEQMAQLMAPRKEYQAKPPILFFRCFKRCPATNFISAAVGIRFHKSDSSWDAKLCMRTIAFGRRPVAAGLAFA